MSSESLPQQFSDDPSDSEVYCFKGQNNIKRLCSVGFAREKISRSRSKGCLED